MNFTFAKHRLVSYGWFFFHLPEDRDFLALVIVGPKWDTSTPSFPVILPPIFHKSLIEMLKINELFQ